MLLVLKLRMLFVKTVLGGGLWGACSSSDFSSSLDVPDSFASVSDPDSEVLSLWFFDFGLDRVAYS